MPRQRIDYYIPTYNFPDDFPERLKQFQVESGLSWSEIARRLETYRHTVWRWKEGRSRPSYRHRKALWELADELGLCHIFADLAGAPVGAESEGPETQRGPLILNLRGKTTAMRYNGES